MLDIIYSFIYTCLYYLFLSNKHTLLYNLNGLFRFGRKITWTYFNLNLKYTVYCMINLFKIDLSKLYLIVIFKCLESIIH